VGERGYELHVPAESAAEVYKALCDAGKRYEQHVGVPVRPIGYRAIDSMSAEKGYRHWHADLSNRDTPLEAGIGFTVLPKLKREGVPFLGREALEKYRAAGLQRRLVCVVANDGNVPLHGLETLWRDGVCVGLVKSTAYGHSIGKSISYGYADCPPELEKITNAWLSEGVWEIGDKATRHPATLNLRAPYDATNSRIKGDYTEAFAGDPKVPVAQ
jgi:sarcosine dehydrogenase